jgi:acyl carrier protein
MTNLKEELRALIAEIAEKDEIPDDVSFKDLGIDSMMGVEIVAAIERKYRVKISDDELVEVTTLSNSMALVQKKLGADAAAAAASASAAE